MDPVNNPSCTIRSVVVDNAIEMEASTAYKGFNKESLEWKNWAIVPYAPFSSQRMLDKVMSDIGLHSCLERTRRPRKRFKKKITSRLRTDQSVDLKKHRARPLGSTN